MTIRPDVLIRCIRESLAAITAPRFFESERGYQGALLAQLHDRLRLPDPVILEQEYQKLAGRHQLTIRPDIIIHEPFDPRRHTARTDGNFAVMELKLRATADAARADFESLMSMLTVLNYRLGIFVNVAAAVTHVSLVPSEIRSRVVCFAVALENGTPMIVEERA